MKAKTLSTAIGIAVAAGILLAASLALRPMPSAAAAAAQTTLKTSAAAQAFAPALVSAVFVPALIQAPAFTPPPGIYVSTTGSDSNAGTYASPYRTIQKGMLAARAGQTVYVRGGIYNQQTIINHGGSATSRITLMAYPGETVTVDGSQIVSGWTQYSGTIYRVQFRHVPTQSADGWVADAAPQSSAPDGWSMSGDRRGFVSVDGGSGPSSWLKPVAIVGPSPEYAANAIPTGSWASDVTPPPGQTYGAKTNWVYVNLGNLADPNPSHHTIRIAGYRFGVVFGSSAAYVTIKGLKFQYQLNAFSSDDRPVHDIVIDSNEIAYNKLRCIESMFGNANWTVRNNNIHDNEYAGIHMEADNSLVENNSVVGTIAPWSVWGSGGIAALGNNITVRGNTIAYMRRNISNGHGGHAIYLESFFNVYGHPESAQNVTVSNNRLYNNEGDGVYVSGADWAKITNNIVYNNTGHAVLVEIAGNGGGTTAQSQPTGNRVYNNTLYNNTGAGVSLDGQARQTVVRNNILYGNAAGAIANRSPDLTQDHNFTANPLFANAGGGDFHLQTSSTAINIGSASGAPNTDADGVARPQGAGFDCGAYAR